MKSTELKKKLTLDSAGFLIKISTGMISKSITELQAAISLKVWNSQFNHLLSLLSHALKAIKSVAEEQ